MKLLKLILAYVALIALYGCTTNIVFVSHREILLDMKADVEADGNTVPVEALP